VRELWMYHDSVQLWTDSSLWLDYLTDAESVLGARITRLDKNDPVRRKVEKGESDKTAQFIVDFGKKEDSRWLFGKIGNLGITFSIHHHRSERSSPNDFPNTLIWYIPEKLLQTETMINRVVTLFQLGNERLRTFYGCADFIERIGKKKKETGAVNIEEELLGVFWLTYFDHRYRDMFGEEKVALLSNIITECPHRGFMVKLADSPIDMDERRSAEAEKILGAKTFVNPSERFSFKRPGEFALTFSQLRE